MDRRSRRVTDPRSTWLLPVPAADPLVLGIGGTSLTADPVSQAAYRSEQVWNESEEYGAAGGGGYSVQFKRPAYQDGFSRQRGRGVPDVSYNGGINGGVLVNLSSVFGEGAYGVFGGTSCGSPQWAGLTVLADQLGHHRIGFVNDSLYRAAANRFTYAALFHDTTVGDNTFNDTADGVYVAGFPATKGWDAASGLGAHARQHAGSLSGAPPTDRRGHRHVQGSHSGSVTVM